MAESCFPNLPPLHAGYRARPSGRPMPAPPRGTAGGSDSNPALAAVTAACDLAESEARHVVGDEVYVSVGAIRNALNGLAPEVPTCESFDCAQPVGHNQGRADVPENHAQPAGCAAPPGNLCMETGCWDADRCIAPKPQAERGPTDPPCMDCEWEAIRDTGGAFVRWKRTERCGDHYVPPCGTPGCGGDSRYSPPGRGHVAGCRHPFDPSIRPGGGSDV